MYGILETVRPDETETVYMPTKIHHYPKGGVYTASVQVTFGSCVQNTGPVPVYVLSKQKPVSEFNQGYDLRQFNAAG